MSRAAAAVGSSSPSGGEVEAIVKQLESDRKLLEEVMEKMDPQSRRRLVVAGGAVEWFGKEHVDRELSHADTDNDRIISPKDFDKWFESALKRKSEDSKDSEGETDQEVPWSALFLIALEAALPFVGFGFLDNAIMILAGDAIDQTVGLYFHCSVLASAAMGNIVSGMLGMQVHGGVEQLIQWLNLPTPKLSAAQRRSQKVFLAGHLGGTVGIAIGLSLGMLCLLLTHDDSERVETQLFDSLDLNKDHKLTSEEVVSSCAKFGINIPEDEISHLMQKFGNGSDVLDLAQFKELCEHLKQTK